MRNLAVTGVGCLSSAGVGADALGAVVARRGPTPGHEAAAVGPDPGPLPSHGAHTITGLDFRRAISGRGVAAMNRYTRLAVVAGGHALADSGFPLRDGPHPRVGVVIGSGEGSLKSTCDYACETLTDPRPYQGSPVLFPGTIMNCAASQVAIRYRLRGPNVTIAASQLAFLSVLRYAAGLLADGHAETVLAGVSEEFTEHAAWLTHFVEQPSGRGLLAGEGAAMFVLEQTTTARRAGRHVLAEVLSVVTGFAPRGPSLAALTGCARRALDEARVRPAEVASAACEDSDADVLARCGVSATRVAVKHAVGECRAASGGLLAAAVLAGHRDQPARDGQSTLIVGRDRDGGVGAAVVRAWSGPHRDDEPASGHEEGQP